MKLNIATRIFVLNLILMGMVFSGIVVPTTAAQTQTQDSMFALQRGYRTGYSDGYMAGYRDKIDSVARNYTRHAEYTKADRAFNKDYGSIDDYKDGYTQGFESGYDTGFDRRSFESSLPTGLKRRGVIVGDRQQLIADNSPNTQNQNSSSIPDPVTTDQTTLTNGTNYPSTYQQSSNAIIVIPRETELILELLDDVSTEQNREGDKFTARIVSPSEIAGATVEGRISKIMKPGRIKRRSEMTLSFDRIILSDARWSNFSANLTEVLAVKGDNVKRVDDEGTALGQSSLKGDIVKVGGSTGAGALIGGVVGGPVGVAVGAGVGAAFGVGAVVIERGKHIRLNRNQQLRIKTAYETQIR
ncbi:MAG: hypothetical protein WBO10_01005 [Pyrinomonadaceae bacterium]